MKTCLDIYKVNEFVTIDPHDKINTEEKKFKQKKNSPKQKNRNLVSYNKC